MMEVLAARGDVIVVVVVGVVVMSVVMVFVVREIDAAKTPTTRSCLAARTEPPKSDTNQNSTEPKKPG